MRILNHFKRNKVFTQVLSTEAQTQLEYQRGNVYGEFPSDFSEEEKQLIQSVNIYTMTSYERLVSLSRAVEYIEKNGIEGDIVECGVWKGGSMMLAAQMLVKLNNQSRRLFLFDTFEGMSKPDSNDVSFNNIRAADIYDQITENNKLDGAWCYSSIDEVKANLKKTGYNESNMHFIKGKVEDTLPLKEISKVSILRLDTDWYESTRHELETLYDKLVVGGVLIIDDYGHWAGARKAVDEFIEEKKCKIFLTRIDYTCRLAIKIN